LAVVQRHLVLIRGQAEERVPSLRNFNVIEFEAPVEDPSLGAQTASFDISDVERWRPIAISTERAEEI
jgi:hypothetical protein